MQTAQEPSLTGAGAAQIETFGFQINKMLSVPHVNPLLRDIGALVADYVDGKWLEDEKEVGKRTVSLCRKLLVRESEYHMCQESLAKAESKARGFEAQLLTLMIDEGGSTKLRQELDELRSAMSALQKSMGDRMGIMFEERAAALAEENAALKGLLSSKESELTELKEVMMEMKRANEGGERVELGVFGSAKREGQAGSSLKKREKLGEEGISASS